MTIFVYQSTYYNKHILRVCVDGKGARVPSEVVQMARRTYNPDRKPGCEIITGDQAKFVRSTPPRPDVAATLSRRLRAMGYETLR